MDHAAPPSPGKQDAARLAVVQLPVSIYTFYRSYRPLLTAQITAAVYFKDLAILVVTPVGLTATWALAIVWIYTIYLLSELLKLTSDVLEACLEIGHDEARQQQQQSQGSDLRLAAMMQQLLDAKTAVQAELTTRNPEPLVDRGQSGIQSTSPSAEMQVLAKEHSETPSKVRIAEPTGPKGVDAEGSRKADRVAEVEAKITEDNRQSARPVGSSSISRASRTLLTLVQDRGQQSLKALPPTHGAIEDSVIVEGRIAQETQQAHPSEQCHKPVVAGHAADPVRQEAQPADSIRSSSSSNYRAEERRQAAESNTAKIKERSNDRLDRRKSVSATKPTPNSQRTNTELRPRTSINDSPTPLHGYTGRMDISNENDRPTQFSIEQLVEAMSFAQEATRGGQTPRHAKTLPNAQRSVFVSHQHRSSLPVDPAVAPKPDPYVSGCLPPHLCAQQAAKEIKAELNVDNRSAEHNSPSSAKVPMGMEQDVAVGQPLLLVSEDELVDEPLPAASNEQLADLTGLDFQSTQDLTPMHPEADSLANTDSAISNHAIDRAVAIDPAVARINRAVAHINSPDTDVKPAVVDTDPCVADADSAVGTVNLAVSDINRAANDVQPGIADINQAVADTGSIAADNANAAHSAPTAKSHKQLLREQKKSAKHALNHAWWDREDARKRLAGTWTLEGQQAFESTTKEYMVKRATLEDVMSGGQLNEEDATLYPALTVHDKRARKVKPARPQIYATTSAAVNDAQDAATTVTGPASSSERYQLRNAAINALERYHDAVDVLSRDPPQGRSNLQTLATAAKARIERAAAYYKKKMDAFSRAYPSDSALGDVLPDPEELEIPLKVGDQLFSCKCPHCHTKRRDGPLRFAREPRY
jgi:hypothetical protein